MFGAFKFAKSAGRKISGLFGGKKGKDAAIKEVHGLGLGDENVDFDINDDGEITIRGKATTQERKERIILALGNLAGVSSIKDEVETEDGGTASDFHEVVSGDTLWHISKKYYGKGSRYMEIFEANTPMLSHPDKIYVGQTLRIPVDAKSAPTASV